MAAQSPLASSSVQRHLLRGVAGFGLLVLGVIGMLVISPLALLLAIPGFVFLRGCPTCWTVGLLQTLSDRRACADGSCARR